MIEVVDLHKHFKTVHALKGISLNVRKGEIYGFIGQNGAGKSTTMNILAGLSRPDSGQCVVNGKDVREIHHPSDLRIGYLPEEPRFYPWLSAKETLDYLGSGKQGSVSRQRIGEVLDWVGLSAAAGRRVGGFSRGMKQRLGIGAALLHDPELLILDEPSSALDPEGRKDVLNLIIDLRQMGKTVIFSSHILSDVERVCDTVGMIVSGQMAMEKPLQEILGDVSASVFDIILQVPVTQGVIGRINDLDGVMAVSCQDNQLAVTVHDAVLGSTALMRFLADESIAVQGMTLRKNSLEDIFIQGVNGK